MTDNEEKLEKSSRWYRLLKAIGDATPLVIAVMLAIILTLQLVMLPYIYLILNSERAQDLTREGIIKYRQDRIVTENQILENQRYIIQKLDSALKK